MSEPGEGKSSLLCASARRAQALDGPDQLKRCKCGGKPEDMAPVRGLGGQPIWHFTPRGGLSGGLVVPPPAGVKAG